MLASDDMANSKPPAAQVEPSKRALALVSINLARERIGGPGAGNAISRTSFYKLAKEFGLILIPVMGRSMVREDQLEQLINLLTDEAIDRANPHQARAKALAPKAVAARKAKREGTA